MNEAIINVVQRLVETLLEMQMRRTALAAAVQSANMDMPDEIVSSAETFYKFLNG